VALISTSTDRATAGSNPWLTTHGDNWSNGAKSTVASYKAGLPEEQHSLVRTMTSNLEVRQKDVSNMLDIPSPDFEKCTTKLSGGPERGVLRTRDVLLERVYAYCLEAPLEIAR
jgi:hypothetical protein